MADPKPYTVTDEDGESYVMTYPSHYPNLHGEWATDAEDAATMWAERHHSHYDYPEEMIALVTDPEGNRWRVTVLVESQPVFSAATCEAMP